MQQEKNNNPVRNDGSPREPVSNGTGKSENALREEKILEFWRANNIFEKSVTQREGDKEFVFYEGPPTANGKPGIHHLEARSFKDAIPRYKTMRGYHVRRKGGWDTHGLPVELQVEKALGLNSKKAIEEYGIGKFNQECKESVWEYVDLWAKFTDRIGYWVDLKNPYVTYDNNYIESVWNVLATVEKQELLYKDYKVVPWCPRCGTGLSSHELAQGYEDVKDISITAKFKVKGEDNTYILAWTTTPWTLPGNVALAVGNKIDYVKVQYQGGILESGFGNKDGKTMERLVHPGFYILAKARLGILPYGYKIIAEIKGKDLVGLEYEPLFPYIKNAKPENIEKAYKVYSADFVTTEDGTGVVHTAVMYGQDDFELGTKVGLPKYHLVNPEGKFVKGTDFLESRFVKEKSEDGKPVMDIDIIKYLQEANLFFHKELYEHSYPHCWRCHTPLIYYARDSWYIRMSDPKVKNKLISENKKINWEPEHIREGRFGEWLRELKDWAISRERYWGTPLPIWVSPDGEKIVIDSIESLHKHTKVSNNQYFVMRHGQTTTNLKNLVSNVMNSGSHLTEAGIVDTKKSADKLKNEKIDLVFVSPFNRTRETAKIVGEELELKDEQIIFDDRLGEMMVPSYEGKTWMDYHDDFPKIVENFDKAREGDESYQDVKSRVVEFLFEIEEKYKDKKILIITHGGPAWLLSASTRMFDKTQTLELLANSKEFHYFENSEVQKLEFKTFPHDEKGEVDLHRPYIDKIVLEKNGKEFHRVKEVIDVWFDSGAMPFAQDHYPFDDKFSGFFGNKKLLYPADFISEAVDQTRGWFYTLHAIGTLMGKGRAYNNVICLGHILDEKGKKMSKSLGNIVDPWVMIEKYGVDTLRLWMYSVNAPGDSKNFDEKTVLDLNRQVFGLLYNVLAFYELYRDKNLEDQPPKVNNILDQWIMARFYELAILSTKSLDSYKLLEPVRAIRDFIGDLSTWYLRRSRERIKDGDIDAKQTLYFILKNLAKVMAPFAPFTAEDIWLSLKTDADIESVHLTEWPKEGKVHSGIIENMRILREVVSAGLKERQVKNVPVRQPLQSITLKDKLESTYEEILKDELNVKEVKYDSHLESLYLDFELTPELKLEGSYRELLRSVQDMRKEMGLKPSDVVTLVLSEENKELALKYETEFKKTAGLKEIKFEGGATMHFEGVLK